MKNIIVFIFILITIEAKHLHKEKFYQNIFCKKLNGVKEYTLDDKSRVDCLTKLFAIEVDFANKWAEAIGQSLYYSYKTKRKAGVLLILEQDKDKVHLERLKAINKKYDIKIWTIDKELKIRGIK